MRKYSAAAIGLILVGLLSACGDPNEEVKAECTVPINNAREIDPVRGNFETRQIKVLRKDQAQVCDVTRDLASAKQLFFCASTGATALPCVEPDAQQPGAEKPNTLATPLPFTEPPVVAGIDLDPDTLIAPTDKQARLEKIKEEQVKNDPFLELPAKIPPIPRKPTVKQPTTPTGAPPRTIMVIPRMPIPTITEKPTPPPPPDPAEAKAVKITGIIEIGSELVAIASIPNDRLPSRTIRVGQRIADGKVLVKRIDSSGLAPSVVLEQFGIEVKRGIGDVVTAAAPSQLPSAPTP